MNYTENLSLGLPEYGESADVAALNRNSGILDAYVYNTRQMECEPYDPDPNRNPPYMSGDLSIHNEEIYECNTDNTTGAWDDSKWDSTTLAEQIAKAKQMGGESALADLDDVEITNPSTGQALLFDDDDDVWKNQNLPDVSVTKTATGNPIELTDAASAPIVKCTTEIQGSQDLHGYDKPWVGGGGKNKCPKGVNSNLNGIIYTVNNDGSVTITGTASATSFWAVQFTIPEGSYIMSGCPTGGSNDTYNISIRDAFGGTGIAGIPTDNGNGSNFSINSPLTAYLNIRVSSGYAIPTGGITFYPMIRLSTVTDSTFEPYSNICPITAYTEGEIVESDGDGNVTTHTTTYPSAIYRGSEDVVNGTETHDRKYIDSNITSITRGSLDSSGLLYRVYNNSDIKVDSNQNSIFFICNKYDVVTLNECRTKAQNGEKSCCAYGSTVYIGGYVGSESDLDTELLTIQFAYETEPSTSSVTPTNLPIRTLSGYNHIESSTGDMEVEYITQEYQPLVDLIQSGTGHTYSTSEQVVGKWIDGRDLYERTVVVSNPVYTGVRTTIDDPTFTNCEIVSFNGYFTRSVTSLSGAKIKYPIGETESNDYYTKLYFDEYLGTLAYAVKFDVQPCTEICIIVRYTKTTTTRSLSATLTSQKAPIEPLTDKTEEVPTEEEKAVNEEENTNENR